MILGVGVFIERSIAQFLVFADETLITALSKISSNKSGFLCVIEESGHAVGILTDGDIRRWMIEGDSIDINARVSEIANTNFTSLPADTPAEKIQANFSDRIRAIPLVDGYGRVVAIALSGPKQIVIGDRRIGAEHPCFIIAEIGNNHQGSLDLAIQLVDLAADAGADCAKFQMRDMTTLYRDGGRADDPSQDLGAQYTLDLLARFSLEQDDMFRAFDHCRKRGLEPMCTPWDLPSLEALERYGMPAYKVASADLTNHDLLLALIATGKPMICSTGMASESEIKEAVKLLQAGGSPFCLLHTNSTYPAPYKDINLRYLDRLAEIGGCPVGYSGHERGWEVPIAAVARGACVVEKHFTVDRGLEGNDHKVSLLPDEMAAMVAGIRAVEESLGSNAARVITQGEIMNREVLAKSLHAVEDIAEGTRITDAMVVVQSPGQGLQPNRRGELIGRIAQRAIKAGSPFFPTDLDDETAAARPYSFDRPWGIPVRWHDYRKMLDATNLDLLEYHLSYKDMEVDLADWFTEVLDIDYVVHAPELFAGDHILDLTSADDAYRAHSIREMQRVIDVTRALKPWHAKAGTPLIVTNVGGFSTARALPVSARAELLARLEDSLSKLDREGVEIIPQTMPPYPWHFGGQSYHNLFMDPDEIVDFCSRNAMRVCLDISHSQLACNAFQWSMLEFCEKVAPYTAHMHIVDAKGVDGEGLQIGEGNIDFAAIARVVSERCPQASFIPEIWQGHKNDGHGFWLALARLEQWFGTADRNADQARKVA